MAFIYNLTDSWNDVTTTWNGIKLAVTNTASDSSSKLLNLTVSGATTASFVVDKSGNLDLNGKINKVTITAPATAATFTLADNSTFATVGGYATTFTFSGATSLTFPTSGTVTALGNSTTGSGDIVLATSPSLVSPALGTPSSATLTNATGLPVATGISGFGTGVATALGVNIGTNGSFVVRGSSLGTPSSGDLSNCTGYVVGNISGLGAGVATWLGTPSSANLAAAVTDETGSGSLVFATSPTLVTPNLGTPSAATLTNATGLPISTGVSGLGTGVATFLGTPSSANLAAAVTDETGTGPLVFATSPTFTSDVTLGTQSTTRGSLVLANTTAGSKAVTLQSSNSTAAAYTLTLPAAAPVNGYYLQTDNFGQLSWAAGGGGGGGSPGGSNTQIQYNNAGAFGGDASFTFVNGGATATMSLGVASTTSGVAKLYNASSANAITIASGNNASAWTMTLPTSGGTNGYFLQTDGSGNTTWAAAASGTINTGTVGQITYYSGTNALSGTTTGTGVLTALGVNVGSAGAFVVNGGALGTPSSGTLTSCTGLPLTTGVTGVLPVANGGTNASVAGITAFNNITGYSATGATGTTSTDIVFSTSPTITTPTISGNETHTGTGSLFLADFSNATVTSRFAFQSSTTNGSTGIYALPNGTSTAASWQATNNATATNCSKILIATNGSTDVQLVSGINGTGTYLPLSFYTSGSQQMQLTTTGEFLVGTSLANLNNQAGVVGNLIASRSDTSTVIAGSRANIVIANPNTTTNNSAQLDFATLYDAAAPQWNTSAAISCVFGARTNTSNFYASGQLVFSTCVGAASSGPQERMRITSVGNVLVGGIVNRGTTVGTNHFDLFDGTAPAGTLTNGISLYSSSGDFNFMDSSGNGYKVGFRNIPQNAQTSAYVAVAGDVGKHISITTGGVTVNASVFSAGDVFTIYNNSGSNQTITAGTSVTFRLAGTATTGNRTLAQYGTATLLCVTGGATPTFVVSGAGVT